MKLDKVIAVRANKTVYRDGDYSIKVFDEPYSKADILNEALNQARVEETGIRMPKLVEVTRYDGKWAIVNEFIEGRTLAQIADEETARFEELMLMFVDIQLDIHTHRSPLLTQWKDKMHRKISASPLDATTRYDLHMRLDGLPTHDKLCHGDFNLSNIIISDKDGAPYTIDWAHATQGNASADAARTYLLFRLAENVKAADLYLHLFCKKSDTAKQYVQRWLPIVAASQMVKGRPEEHEFLIRWVSVVDYQ